MATKLRNMEVTEGSLVGRGANQEADLILFKSADSEDESEDDVEKAGRKISGKRLAVLNRFKEWFNASPIQDLENMMDEATTETQKGDLMADDTTKTDEPVEDAVDVEALQKRIDELEEENTSLKAEPEDSEEDVLKNAPEEIQKAMTELQERVEKSEQETADLKEQAAEESFAKKASPLSKLGESGEVASVLRKAYDVSDEHGETVEKMLTDANTRLVQSDLFKELGNDGIAVGDSETELDKLAKARADKDGISFEKAYGLVLDTPEGAALYETHSSEVN